MRYSHWLPASLLVAASTLGVGCHSSKPVPVTVNLVVDTNRNGVVEPGLASEDDGEETWDATHGAIFLANLDDDDSDGTPDANDNIVNGADDIDDLSPMVVQAWPKAPKNFTAKLALVPVSLTAAPPVRIFRVVGDPTNPASYIAETDVTNVLINHDELVAGISFAVEGTAYRTSDAADQWDGYANFTLTIIDPKAKAGVAPATDTVRMRVAPVVFQHNLAPTETIYYTDYGPDNQTLADGINLAAKNAGGVKVDPLELDNFGLDDDQWAQDFYDVAYTSKPGPNGTPIGMKIAIRSAQPDRTAGEIVTDYFLGPNWAAFAISPTDFPSDHSYSMNSFGNWDVIPPYSKDGVDYPMGRNFWGRTDDPTSSPDADYQAFVRAQSVQPQFNVDTSWLSVGHVDEFTSWVKTSSPRGWTMLLSSPSTMRDMMMNMDGAAIMFKGKMEYVGDAQNESPAETSISAVLADADIMASSQTSQTYCDSEGMKLKTELGLADSEIIVMPFLYEHDFGDNLAYQPGTVNLLYVDGHVVIPDPFGPLGSDGKDPFKEDLKTRLAPTGLDIIFADDWDLYHIEAGEVHCGSNVSRNMNFAWWGTAR